MNRRSKYNNVITIYDGKKFASIKEANYYKCLLLRKKAGDIADFECQKCFPIIVNKVKICKYYADFVVYEPDGKRVVVDVKGYKTRVYSLKKRLMRALYGIEIVEV